MNNYEKIKQMTVEEMAKYLVIKLPYKDNVFEVLIDKEDYNKIKDETLHIFKNSKHYRCRTGKHIYLHRIIMNCPKGLVVDHINHNTLDNRKENLRICTPQDNMKNLSLYRTNKTGYSAIRKRYGKFIVQVERARKQLGKFNTLEEAIKARDEYYSQNNYICHLQEVEEWLTN